MSLSILGGGISPVDTVIETKTLDLSGAGANYSLQNLRLTMAPDAIWGVRSDSLVANVVIENCILECFAGAANCTLLKIRSYQSFTANNNTISGVLDMPLVPEITFSNCNITVNPTDRTLSFIGYGLPDPAVVRMENCHIHGGFWMDSIFLNITNCAFIDGYSNGAGGGCLRLVNITTGSSISHSSFVGCYSEHAGGAISLITLNQVTISDTVFDSNAAATAGGAIAATADSMPAAHLILDSVLVLNNTLSIESVGAAGGALWTLGVAVSIQNSTFLDNQIPGMSSEGGHIYFFASDKDFFINDTLISGGYSYETAGVHVAMANNVVLQQTFINNLITQQHGGAFISFASQVNITDCEFFNNSVVGPFPEKIVGVVLRLVHSGFISRTNFAGNTMDLGDGAILALQDIRDPVFMNDVSFINNHSPAAFTESKIGSLFVYNSIVECLTPLHFSGNQFVTGAHDIYVEAHQSDEQPSSQAQLIHPSALELSSMFSGHNIVIRGTNASLRIVPDDVGTTAAFPSDALSLRFDAALICNIDCIVRKLVMSEDETAHIYLTSGVRLYLQLLNVIGQINIIGESNAAQRPLAIMSEASYKTPGSLSFLHLANVEATFTDSFNVDDSQGDYVLELHNTTVIFQTAAMFASAFSILGRGGSNHFIVNADLDWATDGTITLQNLTLDFDISCQITWTSSDPLFDVLSSDTFITLPSTYLIGASKNYEFYNADTLAMVQYLGSDPPAGPLFALPNPSQFALDPAAWPNPAFVAATGFLPFNRENDLVLTTKGTKIPPSSCIEPRPAASAVACKGTYWLISSQLKFIPPSPLIVLIDIRVNKYNIYVGAPMQSLSLKISPKTSISYVNRGESCMHVTPNAAFVDFTIEFYYDQFTQINETTWFFTYSPSLLPSCAEAEFIEYPPSMVSFSFKALSSTSNPCAPLAVPRVSLDSTFTNLTLHCVNEPAMSLPPMDPVDPPVDAQAVPLFQEAVQQSAAGPIAGGIIGALLAVGLIAFIVILLMRRRRSAEQSNKKENPFGEETPLAQQSTAIEMSPASTSSQPVASSHKTKPKKEKAVATQPPASSSFAADTSGIDQAKIIKSSDIILMHELGKSNFSSVQVFLATHMGQFVAVKKLSPGRDSEAQVKALLKEAAIMASIRDNKNIVKMVGVCAEASFYGIVMEFCPRGSVSNYIKRRGAVSEYEIFKLAFGILAGMIGLVGSSGIVHRDLAARNVLLDEHSFAKVSDFGISRRGALGSADAGPNNADNLGPVKWAAPEVIKSQEFSEKSDVWSFGATLIEIVTGAEPYANFAGDLLQLAVEIRDKGLDPLTYMENQQKQPQSKMPSWLQPIVRSCFKPNPEDRPTFRELRYHLVKSARDLSNEYENESDEIESLLRPAGNYAEIPDQQQAALVKWTPISVPRPSASTSSLSSNKIDDAPNAVVVGASAAIGEDGSSKIDLNNVETLGKLGAGSYGAVYLGITQGQYVAVKVLNVSGAESDVQREASVMTSIRPHRNIVQMYGLLSKNSQLSIIMEFVPRGALDAYVKATPRVPEATLFKWAVGIARGMEALAVSNVVHRDLAARNVLLDSTLEPKISDFGMSRTVLDPNQESSTNTAVGPIRWFAPECYSLKYSEKSDVWAFGCTLMECITGELPFHTIKVLDVAVAVRDEGRTPLETLASLKISPPAWLIETLNKCFQQDAKQRPTFTELVSFLESRASSIDEVRDLEAEIQKRRERRAGSIKPVNPTLLKQ